jgi:Catalytic LigB subunit of aromatic ring-opening dioxygenase
MADLVMAYAASHAPMMAADRESAPRDQADRFFGALQRVRERAVKSEVEAVVMLSGEHFTNFFLDNLPQIAIGLGEGHQGPLEKWLKIPKVIVPGEPALAGHILDQTVAAGFQPALSHKMKADHGFMTVYYELDPLMRLPMVPIVMNCTTPPLMTLRQCYEFGKAVGEAIRSYPGLNRVALCAGGGLSHFVGEPRIGDIDEEFDRWFVKQLEQADLGDLLDMPNDELMEAGNRTGEVRAWVAVAGAMHGHPGTTLSYEPIYEWINGMGVVMYDDELSSTA